MRSIMVETLRNYCLSLPFVTEDMKWGDNLCFSVSGKLFLIVSLDEIPISASFKVSETDFFDLTNLDNFVQAPYFAKNQWVKVLNIDEMGVSEFKAFIIQSYKLIVKKLPKKTQLLIAENLGK